MLSIIAAWYTKEPENWKAIAKANPGINPDLIHEGDRILIPASLMKTREPMPREFVERSYSKPRKEKARPRALPARAQEEEPKLFGPKKYPNR